MKKLSNSLSSGVRPVVVSKLKFNAARSTLTLPPISLRLVDLYALTGNLRTSTLMMIPQLLTLLLMSLIMEMKLAMKFIVLINCLLDLETTSMMTQLINLTSLLRQLNLLLKWEAWTVSANSKRLLPLVEVSTLKLLTSQPRPKRMKSKIRTMFISHYT